MAARPTHFSEALAAEICRRLADGELLCDICRPARMPSRDTVRGWQSEHGPFRDRYAAARDQQADALAEEAIQIARNADADSVAVCRLQIDTIKWLIAKIAPRRYGDKVLPDATVRVSIGDAIEKGRERVARLRAG
ncbi:hypothetical protein [Reyranella sp.]|jgi:hypothetical protein|uniref:terminase small subunit-like protein n=1 Tax=Reyranella sp. TaxID=1929291 RepID=UPI000BC96DC9|nr:hypothetical protein [Reyranella sp.]OYY37123.1 MAG: hypothetical protein B7Y57_22980 [Rhodospirillales bacterium 35-66-84]OYZ94094.1 MAG: hypothetical protein B7Y08_13215 [Rhodospirillales bacterium 24-66-33]OZB22935.1 MAG: hypothetical protein B7X63_20365 [Rhodospirillales bacterium 39-66-50]HQS17106.1 hypothetical protein [Reyranella sp.]HQT13823.1 hypothetical protein [Reyranella sp.]